MATAETATRIAFDNSYARLPERFFVRLPPTAVAAPRLIRVNTALARHLEIDPDWLASPEGVEMLAGNRIAAGSEPIAQAYAGHQFGGFSPQLGDGRAILLGEVIDGDGVRRDIQLKGSGPTPFSRRGDGRAALGPVLREYIISEAMAALGVPTTRSLAAVMTGEHLWRETAVPGAVLTRIASSHIRVGTFQFFAARGDIEGVRTLADHVIERHYPEAKVTANPYRALLDGVIARQAALVARWMLIGFIHGVMNTDNMAVSGETIDYGPCAFMDTFRADTVYSSIDTGGRYAYNNQGRMAQWNLARLAETLLPLLDDDEDQALAHGQAAIGAFSERFERAYTDGMRRKLGLFTAETDDLGLAGALLEVMAAQSADFTLTFRGLGRAALGPDHDDRVRRLFDDPGAFDAWALRWRERLSHEPQSGAERRALMDATNPAVIPRNHQVEAAISAAQSDDDFSIFERLVDVLAAPFKDRDDGDPYTLPPKPEQVVHKTFCGT